MRDALRFTIAATREHPALLDAIQYAVGGPCLDAALRDVTVRGGDSDAGPFDQQQGVEFARASAAHGVLSTLSLPVHAEWRLVGGVNLYAATPNAFAGREQRLADILGGWAPGAVHNADLSFSTRAAARQAPQVLDDMTVVDLATGVVIANQGVDEGKARQVTADAAGRAGLDELAGARELTRPFHVDHDPS